MCVCIVGQGRDKCTHTSASLDLLRPSPPLTNLEEVLDDLHGDDVADVLTATVHALAVGDPDAVALLVQPEGARSRDDGARRVRRRMVMVALRFLLSRHTHTYIHTHKHLHRPARVAGVAVKERQRACGVCVERNESTPGRDHFTSRLSSHPHSRHTEEQGGKTSSLLLTWRRRSEWPNTPR